MKDPKDLPGGQGRQTADTSATGSAPARSETESEKPTGELERVDEGNKTDETHDKARAAGASTGIVETAETNSAPLAGGFEPFRLYANRALRRNPAAMKINHMDREQTLTEITPDGQLRLELDGAATLIPFDDRVIPTVLEQLYGVRE